MDVSAYPAMTSPHVLADALYRRSLEELHQLPRSDGAPAAGATWPGVWTRDVALSTVLALAFVAPDAARTSVKATTAGRPVVTRGAGALPVREV